ncbi:BUD13 homolog [Tribolium madens]|uniref:BUD13 homolog n=1 Tax=Tribolium madens TaxID=41895 RepID=UPI001CF7476F|nr:BUD13 homolog [Tribolium madens]
MTEPINQKEYLKKYLNMGKAPGEKKKKKKKKPTTSRVQIIDDDADANLPSHVIEEDLALANEDAPQIVAIIDERPPSMRVDEKTKNPLWQPIGTVENSDSSEAKQMIKSFKIAPKSSDKPFALPDKSPPRRKKKTNNGDNTPPTGSRSDTPPIKDENSPPRRSDTPPRLVIKEERRSEARSFGDYSPPRRSRNGDPDISPPRSRRDDDISPPRRRRDDDISPPRKRRDNDISPPRKRKNDDISPPRKRRENDNSPPRKRRNDSSPLRRNRDSTVERSKSDSRNRDTSPSRRKRPQKEGDSPPRKHRSKTEENRSEKMKKTLDGKSAGLQNARELAEETKQFRSREDQMFKTLSKDVSGENAETVHRNRKTGQIRNLEEEEEIQRKKREKEEENKEKYSRWGRGLVQVENREQQIQEQLHEMSKPLARYADDEDLERYLKEQEREGDPMLAYIRKKKKKKAAAAGEVEKPLFEGNFMPNRYGIRPGHRWDGVDRSNGYEKKWFEVQNAKKAILEDSYKWSTEDM